MRGLPGWLTSRWIVVPGALALAACLWNLYVGQHNDGFIEGRVVTAEGRPAAAATVVLLEQNVTTFSERTRTITDEGGRFRFTENRTHHPQLFAEKEGMGRSARLALRLWFRGQNTTLEEPLVLPPATPPGASAT
jgi:Carboxypeptidase regulatory-like domain